MSTPPIPSSVGHSTSFGTLRGSTSNDENCYADIRMPRTVYFTTRMKEITEWMNDQMDKPTVTNSELNERVV